MPAAPHSSPRGSNSTTAFPEGSGPWGFFFVRVHGSTIGEPSFFAQKSACEPVRTFQNAFAAVRKGSPWNH